MLEIPEAITIANQLEKELKGKRVENVAAGYSPHKFAWLIDGGVHYHALMVNKVIEQAIGVGGMVEVKVGDATLVFADGVSPRFFNPGELPPEKHQLLLTFDDLSHLSATVQMYGGISCFIEAQGYNNAYYQVAKQKPSTLSEAFDMTYFWELVKPESVQKLSAKAFLATEQRIPGLGNGVLQDILWHARIHPKRKVSRLSDKEIEQLYHSIKTVLQEMVRLGGRDTEKDLYGKSGGYETVMSSKKAGGYCPACGGSIIKEAYMGGSVYYCTSCQPL